MYLDRTLLVVHLIFLQVAGKLEIRVVPKDLANKANARPQTLSPSKPVQNGDADHHQVGGVTNGTSDSPQKPKIERTKSILKQSSKEKEVGDLPSPRRENITFAPGSECPHGKNEDVNDEKETKNTGDSKEVDQEIQCDIRKNNCNQNVTSTGTEAVDLGSKTIDKQIG